MLGLRSGIGYHVSVNEMDSIPALPHEDRGLVHCAIYPVLSILCYLSYAIYPVLSMCQWVVVGQAAQLQRSSAVSSTPLGNDKNEPVIPVHTGLVVVVPLLCCRRNVEAWRAVLSI